MRALVLAVSIASNAGAQLEPLDPSAPQGPYSEPRGAPTEPRPLDEGPGWTYPGERKEDEGSGTKPLRYRIGHRDDPRESLNATSPLDQRFGDQGEFVITTGFDMGLWSTKWDNSEAFSRGASFSPGVDYFFLRDVSVGVEVDLSATEGQGYGADGSFIGSKHVLIGGGPHLGVNLRFSRWFSLYPRLMVGVHRVEQTEETISVCTPQTIGASPTGSATVVRTGMWISLGAPLLFHPASHYFLGFGPYVYRDFSSAEGRPDIGFVDTRFGISLLAGGYFGGATNHEQAKGATEDEPMRRLGDKNTVALIGETTSLQWTRYSGTDQTLSSIVVSPGVDWFATDHVSLGGALTYSNSDNVGFESSGNRVTSSMHSLGALLRLGFDIRVLSWLSLYPRLGLGAGNRRHTLSNGVARSELSEKFAWAGVSVPALVHVADHFFIGFGPSVSHDLQRTYQGSSYQNRGTTVGASALVGGWL